METQTELEQYQAEMTKKRRIQQQALAVLTRAKEAGIPPDMMRIPEAKFLELLDLGFMADQQDMNKKQVAEFCHELFSSPNRLMKIPFILIDGGDFYARSRAGFSILFRMIAWDNNAKYVYYARLAHQLQSWDTGDVPRNVLTEDYKNYDTLFIAEYTPVLAKASLDTGGFLDDIFAARDFSCSPTIFSFQQIIPAKNVESINRCSDSTQGQYVSMFTKVDEDKNSTFSKTKVLRIRVK